MNPELLLAHFDRISEAPDAIRRLRRFILDLAVRGKLVEQDPEEEMSPELRALLSRGDIATDTQLPDNWVRGKVGKLLNSSMARPYQKTWSWKRVLFAFSDRMELRDTPQNV
ncbi:MAG: hypothetical protein WA673_09565 [Candidatus Acidiferrales bacterium]